MHTVRVCWWCYRYIRTICADIVSTLYEEGIGTKRVAVRHTTYSPDNRYCKLFVYAQYLRVHIVVFWIHLNSI